MREVAVTLRNCAKIACEVRRKGEDRVLASGFTRHCFVSSSTFRPVPPPERLVAAIG